MSLKVGMLIAAIVATVAYGYIWLFELTGDPVDQMRYVMDLAGRMAPPAWVIFADAAMRERSAKRAQAQEILESIGGTSEEGGFRLVR